MVVQHWIMSLAVETFDFVAVSFMCQLAARRAYALPTAAFAGVSEFVACLAFQRHWVVCSRSQGQVAGFDAGLFSIGK